MIMAAPTMMIKEKQPLRLRYELKYSINPADDIILTGRLHKLFPHDGHAGSMGTYCVSSLYFDTPYDKALREKIDGVNRREKFRIRCYNEDFSFIRLEKKMKINGRCAKQSCRITLEEVEQILSGDIQFLLEGSDLLFLELYSKMKGQQLCPKTIVAYDREAFLYKPGNVRITLDRNVRSALGSRDFLNPARFHVPVHDGLTVLEIKYDTFLPEIVRMGVQIPNRQASAYSKYMACRRYD